MATTAADDQIIEPDVPRSDDDNASNIAQSIGTDYTSLASSIANYRKENGRTYHTFKDGSYLLPNDKIENDRLDLQHHIFSLTLEGKLHLAPLSKKVERVLDVGTGTGIWAMDFADEHPESHVIGVDLSPVQPSLVPHNSEFVVDDVDADWVYPEDKKFDFIYLRMMTGSIKDWPAFFEKAYDNLNPGGYIELFDVVYPLGCDDSSVPEDSAIRKWSNLLLEATRKSGSAWDSGKLYKDQLSKAGFTGIEEKKFKWPNNTWPKDRKMKELGYWTHQNLLSAVQALSLAYFTRVLGWTPEEVETLLISVHQDLKNTKMHSYWPLTACYGQKPE